MPGGHVNEILFSGAKCATPDQAEMRGRVTGAVGASIAIAAERKALLFELRAAMSLLRMRGTAARERVARLVERFDAENDCADARVARSLFGV